MNLQGRHLFLCSRTMWTILLVCVVGVWLMSSILREQMSSWCPPVMNHGVGAFSQGINSHISHSSSPQKMCSASSEDSLPPLLWLLRNASMILVLTLRIREGCSWLFYSQRWGEWCWGAIVQLQALSQFHFETHFPLQPSGTTPPQPPLLRAQPGATSLRILAWEDSSCGSLCSASPVTTLLPALCLPEMCWNPSSADTLHPFLIVGLYLFFVPSPSYERELGRKER